MPEWRLIWYEGHLNNTACLSVFLSQMKTEELQRHKRSREILNASERERERVKFVTYNGIAGLQWWSNASVLIKIILWKIHYLNIFDC